MVDEGRQRRIEEASEKFAEALADSYRTIYGQAAQTQEQQADFTREFYERVMDNLNEQAARNRDASERLSAQAGTQREAAGVIAQESADAYMEFLNSAFARSGAAHERAVGGAQEAAGVASNVAGGVVGTALGATRAATEGATGGPIAGYDEMNVEEVSRSLDGLSDDQLRTVRDYEERHKNRETVLEQLDRRIRGSA